LKKLALLGSTGSIGTQTLDVVREHPQDFKVVTLAAYHQIDLLEREIREFLPDLVCVYDAKAAADLKVRIADLNIPVTTGMDGLIACATYESVDIVLGAIVGMIGILPTIEAIKAGKDIAIANKETLVTAGHLIMPLVREKNVKLLPVDSEHSAIFQCLHGEEQNEISKILLTCSGGPFRGFDEEKLEHVQVEDALKHPNWSMGAKITIDCASLVNKGLEVMEAKWLFGVDYDQIEVVVHPQSIIHSMVQFKDGAIKAQLGTPDMRIPIQYALYYPDRKILTGDTVDFFKLGSISFEKPNTTLFRGLRLAYEVGRIGGNAPTVFNAANEFAVKRFLQKEIPFFEIYESIEKALNKVDYIANPSLEDVLETERRTKEVLA